VIRIALAKGRVSSSALRLLAGKGLSFPYAEDSRRLILHDEGRGHEAILVKPLDTPVYVEMGIADCGIVGRDVILESDPDVYRLFSLKASECSLCVAGKQGFDFRSQKSLKVASKYVQCSHHFFDRIGIAHQTIKLNGSVELAPLLGMADVIVDIVETGGTLRAHGLAVLETICAISPVFIVNKAALKTKHREISELVDALYPEASRGISLHA
jgi:ATP phosphoribosyltransferase